MTSNAITRTTSLDKLGQKVKTGSKTKLKAAPEAKEKVVKAGDSEPAPANPVPLGRPTRPRGRGISTSVYFANPDHVAYVESLQTRHPKASLSSILGQLLASFVKANDEAGIGHIGPIEVSSTIHL